MEKNSSLKFVFAPDSFKGSLSAEKICSLLKNIAEKIFPDCETISIPMSDGGEGAVSVVTSAMGGEIRTVPVKGPMGTIVNAQYGVFGINHAIIEMAAASGLLLVPTDERDILRASTYGTGQLIRSALDDGYKNIYIAIGGSATNDGGIGCAAALGVRFLDAAGRELDPIPANLEKIADIDITDLHAGIPCANITVMCDVTNPLLGSEGATYIFGPQKGATKKQQKLLEKGLTNYAAVLERKFGVNVNEIPGSGAAGGLGAGLLVFLNGHLKRGIDTIMDILSFKEKIYGADLVITGEGKMDDQSAYGKVASGVGMEAKKQNIPCVAIVGGMGKDASDLYKYGVESIITTINAAIPIETAMEQAEELFVNAAERMFRMIRVGMEMKNRLL